MVDVFLIISPFYFHFVVCFVLLSSALSSVVTVCPFPTRDELFLFKSILFLLTIYLQGTFFSLLNLICNSLLIFFFILFFPFNLTLFLSYLFLTSFCFATFSKSVTNHYFFLRTVTCSWQVHCLNTVEFNPIFLISLRGCFCLVWFVMFNEHFLLIRLVTLRLMCRFIQQVSITLYWKTKYYY